MGACVQVLSEEMSRLLRDPAIRSALIRVLDGGPEQRVVVGGKTISIREVTL